MGKKAKIGRARKDRFYFLAKETGYRSRAAFKLIQLNRKFNFLNKASVLIDLCAAPGSWLQVASKEMPISSQIIGVDLVPIHHIPRVKTFVADITTDKCKQLLHQELRETKADVVLNDGAPNVGTAWSIDEYNQANLCLQSFAIAAQFLKRGGWFISKVFRSRDYEPLKWVLSQFFRNVRSIKPEASRLESAEIFLVGQFYLAPANIDTKFFDSRHVFGELDVPKDRTAVVSAFLRDNKKKRKAEGYEDGDTLYNEIMVSTFLDSTDPLETLAKTNKIVFDLENILNNPLTTSEIKENCEDIQVLGKADIKNLIKWRVRILAAIKQENSENCLEDDASLVNKPLEVDDTEDMKIETEVQRLLAEESKEQKKKVKRIRKEKRKLAERIVLKMAHEGDHIEQTDDLELFSLSKISNLISLENTNQLFGDTSQTGVDDLVREEMKHQRQEAQNNASHDQRLAIEGRKRVHFERRDANAKGNEDYFSDELLKNYKDTGRADLYISSDDDSEGDSNNLDDWSDDVQSDDEIIKVDNVDSDDLDNDGEDQEMKREKKVKVEKVVKTKRLLSLPPGLLLDDSQKGAGNPLLVDLDNSDGNAKKKRKIDSWFGSAEMRDLLAPMKKRDEPLKQCLDDIDDDVDDNGNQTTTASHNSKKTKKQENKKKLSKIKSNLEVEGQDNVELAAETNQVFAIENKSNSKRLKRPLTPEEQAVAVRLIRSVKSRRELVEFGYHKYQFFEDSSNLPHWFIEDEQKHMRKPLPINENEIIKSVETVGKTITKAEQAKARKKARMAKRLKRIRQKAEGISDELSETEKWQQIKQMYKKVNSLNKKRRPLHVIVNSKSGARNSGKKIPKGAKVKIVDKRMKSDLRGQERAAARKKGSKKGGKGKGRFSGTKKVPSSKQTRNRKR